MQQRLVANEVEASMHLDHPAFVKLFQLINSDKHFYIIYEYVNGNNLKQTMTSVGGFTDRQVFQTIRQVLLGVNALHKAGICHRDLKTENIVCEKNFKNGAPVIRICDFGHAMFINKNYKTKNI